MSSEQSSTAETVPLKEESKSSNDGGAKTEAEKATSSQSNENDGNEKEDSRFECNICLDVARDAVISMCGHLFCWPCIHQWLDTRPSRQVCPVCKSGISKEKLIPLYGRGSNDSDPRDKVPPRPQGQRTEEPQQNFPGMFQWGFGDGGHGVQFSLGIGVFPISLFASFFNFGGNLGNGGGVHRNEPHPQPNPQMAADERFVSNVFLYIGFAFVLWLLLF